jgi:hypothetical protein
MAGQIILLFVALSFFLNGTSLSQDVQLPAYEDREAYAVYDAILQAYATPAQRNNPVIRSETDNYKMCLEPDKESMAIIGSAISEYVKLNEKPHRLLRAFDNRIQLNLLTAGELKSVFEQGAKGDVMGGWNNFYRLYPNSGGYITLSAVGFNEDKTVAVVYMGHHCGIMCAEGNFHVLEKKDGKWQPLKWNGNWCSWIS